MRDHRRNAVHGLAGLALLTAFWIFFAPIAVGGRTTYTVTDGVSMLPGLHAGDLALVRERSSYHVGDTVLYRDARTGRSVLHRIIELKSGRYYFKGDSNAFVDPIPVARNALMGELWFHVPRLGRWVGWLAMPAHSAMFAGSVVLALVLAGGKRRRRARRQGLPGAVAPNARRASDPAGWAIPLGALALLAGAGIAAGFSQPLHRTVAAPAYRQSGDFSYSSRLVSPSPAYPSEYALTGQPMLLELFRKLNVRFNYAFTSPLPNEIHGTIALVTAVSAPTGWHQTFALGKPAPFTGNTTHARGAIDLDRTRMLLDRLSLQAGAVGSDYDFELRAIVRISGIVDGERIHETFNPSVPFIFNHQLMRIKAAAAPIMPGPTTQAVVDGAGPGAALHPEQEGAIPRRIAADVAIARLQIDVGTMRIAGVSLAGLTLLGLLLVLPTRRRQRSEHEVIHDRYKRLLIPALILNPDKRAPIELPDFRSLAVLAAHYGHLILHEQVADRHTYGVEEDGRLYVYRIESPARAIPAQTDAIVPIRREHRLPRSAAASARGRTRRRLMLPLGFALVAGVSATLVASVTAGNTVPDTHAGARTQARSVSELTPTQCAGLTPTNLVVMAAGATIVDGTSANDLVLGRAHNGGVVYNGRGGDDCIVAGGGTGTKRLNGGPGADICIGSITLANTFGSCATTYN